MDTTDEAGTAGPKRRRPPFPWFGKAQLWITGSLIVALIGTMLPWFQTFVGSRPGIDTWGFFTAWGTAVGLVGAFSPRPTTYRYVSALGSFIAFGVVVWAAVTASSLCTPIGSTAPCSIGFGLILSGAAALNAVLWSTRVMLGKE